MDSPRRQVLQTLETDEGKNLQNITDRYPVSFSPGSSTRVNTARLPQADQLRDMELAFREEPLSEEVLVKAVNRWILLFAFLAPTALFFLSIVGPIIRFQTAMMLALLLSLAAVLYLLIFPRRRNTRLILKWLFLPSVAVIVFYNLTPLFVFRPRALLWLGVPLLFLFFFAPRELRPLRFYHRWIYTHPSLTPETRRNITTDAPTRPSIWRYVLVVFIVFIGGAQSPALATAVLFLYGLGAGLLAGPLTAYRNARRVLAHYLTYSGRESGAAGVWIPASTLFQRRLYAVAASCLFYLCCQVGLSFYYPTDLPQLKSGYQHYVAQELKKGGDDPGLPYIAALKTVAWRLSRSNDDPKTGGKASEPLFFDSYQGLRENVRREFDAGLIDSPLQRLLALLFYATAIPNLALLALFRRPVSLADRLRGEIEGHYVSPFVGARQLLRFHARNLIALFRGTDLIEEPEPRFVPGIEQADGRPEWQWYVDRLRNSTHAAVDPLGNTVREAEHLFLGVEPTLQFPVLLDRKVISEHCYMVGQTGSGKTSLGIMPLLIQLVRGYGVSSPNRAFRFYQTARRLIAQGLKDTQRKAREKGKPVPERPTLFNKLDGIYSSTGSDSSFAAVQCSKPVPILIIDLKGDPALFHTARIEAEERGQEFLFFTPEKGKATHFFNPFSGFRSESRTFIQLCHLFLDSLSLNHGEGYGRSYYSRRNRQALYDALSHPSQPQTFPELLEIMTEQYSKSENRDSYEALSTVLALSQYEALITTPEQERDAPSSTIDMEKAIEKRQIVYFWLPSAVESISAREIGKLALFALLTTAIDRQAAGLPVQQVYVFIDEFQRLAGENFKIILEQARSFGISAILANQTMSDLRTPSYDLRPTILTNTRMQLYFTINDPFVMKTLSMVSGEEIRLLRSWSLGENLKMFFRQQSQSESLTEGFKQRLTMNDLAAISDHPLELIAHISRGGGYTQFAGLPFRVRTAWPMNIDEYRKRSHMPWPVVEEFKAGEVLENTRSPREIDLDAVQTLRDEQQEILSRVLGETETK